MKIDFIKISPTKNMTLLVVSSVPRAEQTEVAMKLLAEDSDAEQVGFLEPSTDSRTRGRLQMMGGEFCGNASMATGAYFARLDSLACGESNDIPIEVSGASDIVMCHITANKDCYTGTVDMPLPDCIERHVLKFSGLEIVADCVRTQGIVHIVPRNGVEQFKRGSSGKTLKKGEAERALREWSELFDADAAGLIIFDEKRMSMTPLVYVPEANSMVWERGCGSGSAAVGSILALVACGKIHANLSQPGGMISVDATAKDGKIVQLSITGKVEFSDNTAILQTYALT